MIDGEVNRIGIMDEKKLKLLKLALKLGETAIDDVYRTAEYCDDIKGR